MDLAMILLLFLAPLLACAESTLYTTIQTTYTTTTNCSTSFSNGPETSPRPLTSASQSAGDTTSATMTGWFTSAQTVASSSVSAFTIPSTESSADSIDASASASVMDSGISPVPSSPPALTPTMSSGDLTSTSVGLSTSSSSGVISTGSLESSNTGPWPTFTSINGTAWLLTPSSSASQPPGTTHSISTFASSLTTTDSLGSTTAEVVPSETSVISFSAGLTTSTSIVSQQPGFTDSISTSAGSLTTSDLSSTTATPVVFTESSVTSFGAPLTVSTSASTVSSSASLSDTVVPSGEISSLSGSITNSGTALSGTTMPSTGATLTSTSETNTAFVSVTSSTNIAPKSDPATSTLVDPLPTGVETTFWPSTIADGSVTFVPSSLQTTYYPVTLKDGSTSYTTIPEASPLLVETTFFPSIASDGTTTWLPAPLQTASTTGIVYQSVVLPDGQTSYTPLSGAANTTSLSTFTVGDGGTSVTSIIIPGPAPTEPIFASRSLPGGSWTFEPTTLLPPSSTTSGFFGTIDSSGSTVFLPLPSSTTPLGPGFSLSVGSDGQSGFYPFPSSSATSDDPGFLETTDSEGHLTWVPIQSETSSGLSALPFTTTSPDGIAATSSSSTLLPPGFPLSTTTSSSSSSTLTVFPLLTTPLAEPTESSTPSSDDSEWIREWWKTFDEDWEIILPPLKDYIEGSGSTDGDDAPDIGPPDIKIYLDNIFIGVRRLLPKLPKFPKFPKPPGGSGCTASLFDLFRCLANSGSKIVDLFPDFPDVGPPGPPPNAEEIRIEIDNVENLIRQIDDPKYYPEAKGDEDASSTLRSSSSQSCTQSSTSQAEYTTCRSVTVTGATSVSLSETCQTATSTVTGCDIVITGSAITISASCIESTSKVPYATCSPSPVISGTLTTTTTICNTSTSIISGCSISPSGSTTTLSSSSSADRQYCSAGCAACSSNSLPSEIPLLQAQSFNSTSLHRRQLADPASYKKAPYTWPDGREKFGDYDGYDGYFMAHYYGRYPTDRLEHFQVGGGDGVLPYGLPSAKVKLFADVQGQYNLMLEGLVGCTSIVVVSRLGVYISHLWEVHGFSAGPFPDGKLAFETEVLRDTAEGGKGRSNMPALLEQVGKEGTPFHIPDAEKWAGLRDGNMVRSFIFTPGFTVDTPTSDGRTRRPGDIRYDVLIGRLQEALGKWIPDSQPKVVSYPRNYIENDAAMKREWVRQWYVPDGKILFQYDAKERVDEEAKEVNGKQQKCKVQKSRFRLFNGGDSNPVIDETFASPTAPAKDVASGAPLRQLQNANDTLTCELVPEEASYCSASLCVGCTRQDLLLGPEGSTNESLVERAFDDPLLYNSSLTKRAFEDPSQYVDGGVNMLHKFLPNGYEGWMMAYAFGGRRASDYVDQPTGLTTAKVKVFDDGKPYSLMVGGLYGCTSIVVVSKLGVYMNHLWEIPAFTRSQDDLQQGMEDTFDQDVLAQVPYGNPTILEDSPALLSYVGPSKPFNVDNADVWANLFDGNFVQAFVVAPAWETGFGANEGEIAQGIRYPEKVARLMEELVKWVPHSDPVIVPYPQDRRPVTWNQWVADNTARGKVLFEYDPKERSVVETTDEGQTCQVWDSALRLYVGQDPVPVISTHWPSPTSGPFAAGDGNAGGNIQHRQDSNVTNACWYVSSTSAPSLESTTPTSTTLSTSPSSTSSEPATTTTSPSTTVSPDPTSFSSMSFSFAPTTAPTAFTSCDISTIAATISDGILLLPVTYCECDGWLAHLSTITSSDGATASVCSFGSASITAPVQTTTPSTTMSSVEATNTPQFQSGECNINVRETIIEDGDRVSLEVQISDDAGKVLSTSYGNPADMDWFYKLTIVSDSTGLPSDVIVVPILANVEKVDEQVAKSYISFDFGNMQWISTDRDTESPSCGVNDWQSDNWVDRSAYREMVCWFQC